jgi:hypothetical protein
VRIRIYGQRVVGREFFEGKDGPTKCKWIWLDTKTFAFPPRWNNVDAGNYCYVCKKIYDIWLTDDRNWNLLPIRWRVRKLCVEHYRSIVFRTLLAERRIKG